jgi:hypothetical protein
LAVREKGRENRRNGRSNGSPTEKKKEVKNWKGKKEGEKLKMCSNE